MNGVVSLGAGAFKGCTSIKHLDNLPSGLKSIGDSTFERCIGIEKIEKLPANLDTIGEYAFNGCKYIEKVVLPESLLTLKRYAFQNNTYLEHIYIPASTITIGTDAFAGCPDITIYGEDKSVAQSYATSYGLPFVISSIPPTTEEIPEGWLDSGTDANGIDWYFYESGLLKFVGTGAMADYTKTADIPWYGEKLNIAEIEIGNGITHIGSRSFYNCVEATKATIPESVSSIGNYAFRNCENITIFGKAGSYAQSYAISNDIPFKNNVIEELKTIYVEVSEGASKWIFDVTSEDITENAIAYVALYDANGNMLCAEIEDFVADDITSLIINKHSLAKTAKIFVWNNAAKPVSYHHTIEL